MYQLPNGDWITLTDVRQLVAAPEYIEEFLISDRPPFRCAPRLIVRMVRGTETDVIVVNFDTIPEAEACRDKLAAAVTEAKASTQ